VATRVLQQAEAAVQEDIILEVLVTLGVDQEGRLEQASVPKHDRAIEGSDREWLPRFVRDVAVKGAADVAYANDFE
jgi:hypothetical protein